MALKRNKKSNQSVAQHCSFVDKVCFQTDLLFEKQRNAPEVINQ